MWKILIKNCHAIIKRNVVCTKIAYNASIKILWVVDSKLILGFTRPYEFHLPTLLEYVFFQLL